MAHRHLRRPSRPFLATAFAAALACGGCMLLRAAEDQKRAAGLGRIQGTVRTEHESRGPLVVVLLSEASLRAQTPDELGILDHFVREGPGSYVFVVQSASYLLVAFEDADADGRYDPDEPLLGIRAQSDPTVVVPAGARVERDLVIPTAGRAVGGVTGPVDIGALQARSLREQLGSSLGALLVRGEVADLSDEKFGAKNAELGLWQPLEFLIRVGAGIYFTEPYDPERIPILFVHGLNGHPQQFTPLIDALDRSRYQAWFFFYPSGVRLDPAGERGAELIAELQIRHGFRRFAVVAHSMGGLVSRSLLLHHASATGREDVPLFVTISTPWAGDENAVKGVERSPVVVESWRDVAADSAFLKDLFWDPEDPTRPRRLPDSVAWHMLFSVRGVSRGETSTDGAVAIASQLRREAQDRTVSQLGLDESHTGILRSEEARARLTRLLAATFE